MISPGTRLRRYVVQSPLGSGGMGEVYIAHDTELERTVALKILRTDTEPTPERVRRFVQEAKAACALNHPNVAHIYDVGDEQGVRFMAMEYVEGETLRARLKRGPLSIDETIDLGVQIASALASAHVAGIVHRDIKPENVMIRPDGYVKVLDFGLAKLLVNRSADNITTDSGMVMGTVQYMSPEQLRGRDVDARSDVFSLGVVLYELAGGHRPFEGDSVTAVIASILTDDPPPLDNAPEELKAVLAKALEKNRDKRYASARELLDDLRHLKHDSQPRPVASGDLPTQVMTVRVRRKRFPWAIAAAVVAVLAIGAWAAIHTRNLARARAALPRLEQLAEQHRYFEGWDLARSIRAYIPADERLQRTASKIAEELTLTTDPPGANVYLQRVLPKDALGEREMVGVTPLKETEIAKGEYVLTVEKAGYAPFMRSLSTMPLVVRELVVPQPPPKLDLKLLKTSETPARMVYVPGGEYRLTGWARITERTAPLAPFFIDRYEVSNRDFAQFIREGGYRRRELWKYPFVKDGKAVSWEEAMAMFHDATGLAGPRGWAGQKCPEGRDDYPVTDITWYEAAAFAESRGKRLPTFFEWDKTARNGMVHALGITYPWAAMPEGSDVTQRANFRGAGPLPVDSLPAGMSAYGAQHMAGNVKEWLLNALDDGFAATGGAWDEPAYQFGWSGSYPGFFSGATLGFRCVREISPHDQGSFALSTNREVPVFKPVDDATFAKLLKRYEYPPEPLDAKVVEVVQTDDWTREKITYKGAHGTTALAYLYLPKGYRPPFQVVHLIPAGDVANGARPLAPSAEQNLGSEIRSGRALFCVALIGYIDRPRPADDKRDEVEEIIDGVTDLRRGLDYLVTRKEIDASRIGMFGPSAGSVHGMIVTAVDRRYRAVAFMGTGISRHGSTLPAEINRINFAPRITAPKLLLHGKYDEADVLRTMAEPVFRIMREPKDLQIYESGHVVPLELMVPALHTFFDKTMGKV